jgi:hypothetical protein
MFTVSARKFDFGVNRLKKNVSSDSELNVTPEAVRLVAD